MQERDVNISVFVYGTLEIPAVMRAVTGRLFPSEPAVLEGYRRALLIGRPYPGIEAAAGECTEGLVCAGIDAGALRLFDRFEGAEYERQQIDVRLEDGRMRSAHTYRVSRERGVRLGSEPWDREHFIAEHLTGLLEEWEGLRPDFAALKGE